MQLICNFVLSYKFCKWVIGSGYKSESDKIIICTKDNIRYGVLSAVRTGTREFPKAIITIAFSLLSIYQII